MAQSYKILLGAFRLHSVSGHDRIAIERVVLSFGSNKLLHSNATLYRPYVQVWCTVNLRNSASEKQVLFRLLGKQML